MAGQQIGEFKYGKTLATPAGRLSFPKVFKAEGNDYNDKIQFSCSILIPKINDAIIDELASAAEVVAVECFGTSWKVGDWASFGDHNPFKDGDEKDPGDPANGHWIISARSNEARKPFVFDRNKLQIDDQSQIYGGAIGVLWVQPMAYDMGRKIRGVKFVLDAVQKLADAEPFGQARFNPMNQTDIKSDVPDYMKKYMTPGTDRPASPPQRSFGSRESADDVMRRTMNAERVNQFSQSKAAASGGYSSPSGVPDDEIPF